MSIFTIPAGNAFANCLAQGLLQQADYQPKILAQMRILLPTRRACRTLQEAFLQISGGKPLLLPRMHPLGDIDEDEITLGAAENLKLPPAISRIKRQLLLTRLISELPNSSTRGPDQAIALASALGKFMDQIYTEGLDFTQLHDLVPEEFAQHWQITIDFLKILSKHWPKILEEEGVIDYADRRNQLLQFLTQQWRDNPPQYPVIAAGSTGSIPATADLLHVISGLPQGMIVLPGLDQDIDDKSWDALDDTHPQTTLKQLLQHLDCDRSAIKLWPQADETKAKQRRVLIGEVMRPADTASAWTNLQNGSDAKEALNNVFRFDCDTAQEEALTIALALRETIENPKATATVVTADRTLARRIATACIRWGIILDDSAGQALPDTQIGSFLRLCAQTCNENLAPVTFASLLKHSCFGALDRDIVQAIEIDILRGAKPTPGFAGLYGRLKHSERKQEIEDALHRLEDILSPFLNLFDGKAHSFSDFTSAHIEAAEKVAGENVLWHGDDGEAAAAFLADLQDHVSYMPALKGQIYVSVFEQLLTTVNVRPTYGTHPRLNILGQLEARMVQSDLVILAGLNEGSWPPDPGHDPWMSRPMQKAFGLPSPERGVGLAAHDFAQGFCAPKVILTRSKRVDGTPSIPARWLQRLDTVLQAMDTDPDILKHAPYLEWARQLDHSDESVTIERPAPKPPVAARPKQLPVTAIETWMRDPYAVYAKYILNLRKFDDLEQETDAALRGSILHDILDRFVSEYPNKLPDNARNILLDMGRDVLAQTLDDPKLWGFWWPRFERLTDWFLDHEKDWRKSYKPTQTEIQGTMDLGDFILTAKADRIDKGVNGSYALIDYKSGQVASLSDVKTGMSPQLPLEGAILQTGGFAIDGGDVSYLGYWKLSGASKPGEEVVLKSPEELVKSAKAGLHKLVQVFQDPDVPYYSLPRADKVPRVDFQDYAHLARVQEWSSLDESEAA